jgi:hypothetical protein
MYIYQKSPKKNVKAELPRRVPYAGCYGRTNDHPLLYYPSVLLAQNNLIMLQQQRLTYGSLYEFFTGYNYICLRVRVI